MTPPISYYGESCTLDSVQEHYAKLDGAATNSAIDFIKESTKDTLARRAAVAETRNQNLVHVVGPARDGLSTLSFAFIRGAGGLEADGPGDVRAKQSEEIYKDG